MPQNTEDLNNVPDLNRSYDELLNAETADARLEIIKKLVTDVKLVKIDGNEQHNERVELIVTLHAIRVLEEYLDEYESPYSLSEPDCGILNKIRDNFQPHKNYPTNQEHIDRIISIVGLLYEIREIAEEIARNPFTNKNEGINDYLDSKIKEMNSLINKDKVTNLTKIFFEINLKYLFFYYYDTGVDITETHELIEKCFAVEVPEIWERAQRTTKLKSMQTNLRMAINNLRKSDNPHIKNNVLIEYLMKSNKIWGDLPDDLPSDLQY